MTDSPVTDPVLDKLHKQMEFIADRRVKQVFETALRLRSTMVAANLLEPDAQLVVPVEGIRFSKLLRYMPRDVVTDISRKPGELLYGPITFRETWEDK